MYIYIIYIAYTRYAVVNMCPIFSAFLIFLGRLNCCWMNGLDLLRWRIYGASSSCLVGCVRLSSLLLLNRRHFSSAGAPSRPFLSTQCIQTSEAERKACEDEGSETVKRNQQRLNRLKQDGIFNEFSSCIYVLYN